MLFIVENLSRTALALLGGTGGTTKPTLLDNLDQLGSILQAVVTAAAIVVGAVWTYYRFIRDRTYRPRLHVAIEAVGLEVGDTAVLHLSVCVKNIGETAVSLLQAGTGLRVTGGVISPTPYRRPQWSQERTVFRILTHHRWIEPSEEVSDEVLLTADQDHAVWLVEVRLVWKWKGKNIEVHSQRILTRGAGRSHEGDDSVKKENE